MVVLNSTAIEVQWSPPLYDLQNGFIRGYNLFVWYPSGDNFALLTVGNVTSYIVSGLQPSTVYAFSILAYTVGDGPKSIRLSAQTRSNGM